MVRTPKAKLFVFDIGNTLLVKPNTSIMGSAIEALSELRSQNCILGVASMRNRRQLREIDSQYHFDFKIGLNGSYVECNKEVLIKQPLPSNDVRILIAFLKEHRIEYKLHHLDGEEHDHHNGNIHVVEMFDIHQYVDSLPKQFPGLNFCIWEGGRSCDVFSKIWTKSNALKQVCEFYHVGLNQVVGFGDGFNDLDFLEICGKSVAMGTAPEQLKSIATFITRPACDDGVLWAIQNYEL